MFDICRSSGALTPAPAYALADVAERLTSHRIDSTSSTTAPAFAAGRRSPALRTVQGELEAALATVLRRAGRADRRRAHRRRRPRLGPGRQLQHRGRGPRRALRRRARTADRPPTSPVTAATAGRRRLRRPPRRPLAHLLLPGPRAPAPSPFERGRSLWWPHRLDRERARRPAPRRCSAATTSPPSRRPRPTTSASSATMLRAEWVAEGELRRRFWIEADAFMRNMVRDRWSGRCSRSAAGRRTPADFDAPARRARRASRRGRPHRARPLSGLGSVLIRSAADAHACAHRRNRSPHESPPHQRRRHRRRGPARRCAARCADRRDRGPRDRARLQPQRHRAQHHHPLAALGRGGRLRRRHARLRHRRHAGRLRPLRRPRPARASGRT